jgi:hypothetical protein
MNLLKGLRAILVVNLLIIFVQFAFAGLMIGGNDLAVNLHGPTGLLLVLVALIQMSLVVAMKMKGSCPTWLVAANVGLIVAEVVEAICGHFHNTALHVPLALAIFGAVNSGVVLTSSVAQNNVDAASSFEGRRNGGRCTVIVVAWAGGM